MSDRLKLTRRKLLLALATCGVGYYMAQKGEQRNLPLEDASTLFDIALPEDEINGDSFAVFLALSSIVTARTSLDIEIAKKMHRVFLEEPWGKEHILSTYRQLLEILGAGPFSNPPIDSSSRRQLGGAQRWFASHLLATWYLGIYYHESQPAQRITFEHALMFDAVKFSYPVPFVGATGFGRWSVEPTGVDHG